MHIYAVYAISEPTCTNSGLLLATCGIMWAYTVARASGSRGGCNSTVIRKQTAWSLQNFWSTTLPRAKASTNQRLTVQGTTRCPGNDAWDARTRFQPLNERAVEVCHGGELVHHADRASGLS